MEAVIFWNKREIGELSPYFSLPGCPPVYGLEMLVFPC
jgi:hypothetical protein